MLLNDQYRTKALGWLYNNIKKTIGTVNSKILIEFFSSLIEIKLIKVIIIGKIFIFILFIIITLSGFDKSCTNRNFKFEKFDHLCLKIDDT